MPAAQLLIVTFAAALIFAAIMVAAPAVRRRLTGRVVTAIVVASVAATLISLAGSSTRHAGTGISTDRGWPKPYAFSWVDREQTDSRRGDWNALYFAGDVALYGSIFAAAWAAFAAARR
jgi:hypothetical protein